MESIIKPLTDLTWEDLRHWAGTKILNRGKAYVKNVSDLARTEDGELVAWVAGSEDYATLVESDAEGELNWFCSCPYDWGPCKHAVAVILAGIERIKSGKEIPLLDIENDLYLALWEDTDKGDDDLFDEDDFDEFEEEVLDAVTSTEKAKDPALTKILQKKNKEELINLLQDLAGRHPGVKRKIREDEQLASGQTDKLVQALRKEIRAVTGEDAWYNPWKGTGNLPDYSHIKEQLAALLKAGQTDSVVELGRELWEQGNDQVEQSHDEGETAGEIQECMEIVFEAVASSSLSPPDQLIWMIDIFLEDEFSISDGGERFIRRKGYTKPHWAEVADRLRQRLQGLKPRGDGFSRRYQRARVMNWLITALERSGQPEKVLPLLEQEADATQCYQRIAEIYLASGSSEKARLWCIKGYKKTIKDAPGIASGLQKKLRELAAKEKKFDLVASYRAQDFFDRPTQGGYSELRKASEKIKVWPEVRTAVLHFLDSGQRPDLPSKGNAKQPWPLPLPEVMEKPDQRYRRQFPDLDTLIDIAIMEKRFDDVVLLYEAQQKTKHWGFGKGKDVATAVAGTHPDIALGIWKKIAENQINQVKPKAYEEAAVYLRKMQKIYKKTDRLSEWQGLIAGLRIAHKAKRRLMEVLDSLENKRIID